MGSKALKSARRLILALVFLALGVAAQAQSFTVAVPENYETAPGQTLNVGAPGVLANDTYYGKATVNLIENALHGTCVLQTNGSFSYVPNAGYIGPDRIVYDVIGDNGRASNWVTDYIAVGAVNNMGFNQNPVVGGSTGNNGNAYLNYTPSSPITISIKSSNTSVVTVPATIQSVSGQSYGNFGMTVRVVAATTDVAISATYNDYTFTSTLRVVTPSPSAFGFTNTAPTGGDGNTVYGQIYIYGAAPNGGLKISITDSDTSVTTAPTSATILAGQNSVQFPITTKIVPVSRRVTFTATTAGGSMSGVLTVEPYNIQLVSSGSSELLGDGRVAQPAIIGCNDPEGYYNTATFTMRLSSTAPPGGMTLPIYTDSPDTGISGPSSVAVPAGQTSASFKVSVSGYSTFQTALYATSYLYSASTSAYVYLYPPLPVISTEGDDFEYAGTLFPIGVGLEGFAPPGGQVVNLSSNTGYASIPATVTVPAGSDFVEADVTAAGSAVFQPAVLTAACNGYSSSAAVMLLSPQVDQLVLSSYRIAGGKTLTGTLYLTSPAGTGGVKVNLASSPSGLVTPTSVTVPAGKTSVSFTVTTKAVAKNTNVVISAYTWAEPGFGDVESITLTP